MKKIIPFLNAANVFGFLALLAGILAITTQEFSLPQTPAWHGKSAIITGWALILGGVWALYFGIKQGIRKNKER